MKILYNLLVLALVIYSCQNQTHQPTSTHTSNEWLGGPCEGCEAVFEYGNKNLSTIDTLPDFFGNEPKIKLTGKVYENDTKTPAKDVILYIYHTNRAGRYISKTDDTPWGKRHGHFRGWIKTDSLGSYTFYTFRPAAYPDNSEPEHIHITVKEPSRKAYYLDDFVFIDDPLLTVSERNKAENRGGSGIITPQLINGIYVYHRDIILGLNIPNYK